MEMRHITFPQNTPPFFGLINRSGDTGVLGLDNIHHNLPAVNESRHLAKFGFLTCILGNAHKNTIDCI